MAFKIKIRENQRNLDLYTFENNINIIFEFRFNIGTRETGEV